MEVDRAGDFFSEEEQEKDILKRSASLRMPLFEAGTDPKDKIAAYEDHMMLTAYVEAQLVSEKLRCIDQLNESNDEWNDLSIDADYAGQPEKVSMAARERQRRSEDPNLFKHRRFLTQRIESLQAEIDRMERDTKRCSRSYTMLTGS